ncbi:MAG: hypothetical protein J6U43_05295 [Bacteroidales bacterium]|nr:hypothetical protein [Bacteroidales bacterium]
MEQRLSVEELFKELRHYVDLRLQRLKIIVVEKFVYLLAIVAFVCIALLFVCIAICYFSYSFVHLLQFYVGAIVAHLLVGGIMLLAVVLLYWQRRRWILDPIARVMTRVFIDDKELR